MKVLDLPRRRKKWRKSSNWSLMRISCSWMEMRCVCLSVCILKKKLKSFWCKTCRCFSGVRVDLRSRSFQDVCHGSDSGWALLTKTGVSNVSAPIWRFSLAVIAVIAATLFPLWPAEMRVGVYYLSVAAGCFVASILLLAVGKRIH